MSSPGADSETRCCWAVFVPLERRYWRYTRDPAPLLKYFTKIQGIVELLSGRRAQALAAHPAGDPRRGMAVGHDEADLFLTWATAYISGKP